MGQNLFGTLMFNVTLTYEQRHKIDRQTARTIGR